MVYKIRSYFLFSLMVTSILSPCFARGDLGDLPHDLGFKKIPADEALNQLALGARVGAFEYHPTASRTSTFKNLFLAFAIDVRYRRNCSGTRRTALCSFIQSSAKASGRISWTDQKSTTRYEVIFVPVEYVTGQFGKDGPEVDVASSAAYVSIGLRSEYLRDLGLFVRNRILSTANTSLNFSAQVADRIRFIGSLRLFAGGTSLEIDGLDTAGALSGGAEAKAGFAFALDEGALIFTNTYRKDGDWNPGAQHIVLGLGTESIEFKYLRSVCTSETKECIKPPAFSYGGGVRYESVNSSYEATLPGGDISHDASERRVLLFAEISRF